MTAVPAWRVHLGMPMCGKRMVDGRVDAAIELIRTDPLMAYAARFTRQTAEEFPAALAAVRDQLPVDSGPVSILGGSLGGAVALQSTVGVIEALLRQPYRWDAEPAPQLPAAARVDQILTTWSRHQLTDRSTS